MNIFTAVKYCCILHGRVFVMNKRTNGPVNANLISGPSKKIKFIQAFVGWFVV